MIFSDHIVANFVDRFTYHSVGFSDAKEIFIFLAGVSAFLAYGRMPDAQGVVRSQLRSLFRAGQIYVGQIFICLLLFATALSTGDFVPAQSWENFSLLLSEPTRAIEAAVALYYRPGILAILPTYVVLISSAPLLIIAMRRSALLTLAACAGLWLLAETVTSVNLPSFDPKY